MCGRLQKKEGPADKQNLISSLSSSWPELSGTSISRLRSSTTCICLTNLRHGRLATS